jgi:hypothetical protein
VTRMREGRKLRIASGDIVRRRTVEFFTGERGLAVMRSRVGPEHLPSGRPGGAPLGSLQYASTKLALLSGIIKLA